MPEYAVSIDKYEDILVVKEYPAPKSIDKTKSERRLQHVLAALPDALQMPAKNIRLKTKKELMDQDISIDFSNGFKEIHEDNAKFLINLKYDNIETGLPLNQRLFRSFIQEACTNKKCLILFSRSGSLTTSAILGGASSTLNIDERDYHLAWTEANLALNHLPEQQYFHADPKDWIIKQKNKFDIIIAELPESSHRLRDEYHQFISNTLRLLMPNGILYLTSRDKRFNLVLSEDSFNITNITHKFISTDFSREPRPQPYWKISKSP